MKIKERTICEIESRRVMRYTLCEIESRRVMRYTLYKLISKYLESLIFISNVNVKIQQEVNKL